MATSPLAPAFHGFEADRLPGEISAPLCSEICDALEQIDPSEVLRHLSLRKDGPQNHAEQVARIIADVLKRLRGGGSNEPLSDRAWVVLQGDRSEFAQCVAEVVLHLISTKLSCRARCLAEVSLWELTEFAAVASQRTRIGADATVISAEVLVGVRYAFEFFGEGSAPDYQAMEQTLAQLLTDWSACAEDAGALVDVELVRLFLDRMLGSFKLDARLWSLLLLRLDRAFTARASKRLSHAFGAAVAALVGAVPRFDFIADVIADARPYLPADAGILSDLLPLLCLAQLRPEAQLNSRLCGQFRHAGIGAPSSSDFRERWVEAQRQILMVMRRRWERNYLDPLSDALDFLDRAVLLVSAEASSQPALAVIDTSAGADATGLNQRIRHALVEARRAAAFGHDTGARQQLFRMRMPFLCAHGESIWESGATLSSYARSMLSCANEDDRLSTDSQLVALLELLPDICRDLAELDDCSFALTAPTCEIGGTKVWLQRCFELLQVLCCYQEHHAYAELRAWTARVLLAAGDEQDTDRAIDALRDWRHQMAINSAYATGRPFGLLSAFCASLPQLGAGVKIVRRAHLMAVSASAATLSEFPEYAERIGERGRASTLRDNEFTLLRLGQVLGGATASPSAAMTWWWLSTIGIYLVNRDEPVMQGNLAKLAAELRSILDYSEYCVALDVLSTVYRKALSIDIPRELSSDAVLSFDTFDQPSPLWDALFGTRRSSPSHHRALERVEPSTLDSLGRGLLDLWRSAADGLNEHGDLALAWSRTMPIQQKLLDRHALSEIESAWFKLCVITQQSLTPAQSGFWLCLLEVGLDRLRLTALGHTLHARQSEMAIAVADLLPELHEGPPDEQWLYREKGLRDQQLLIRFMVQALHGPASHCADIEVCRYLLTCLISHVPFKPRSWRLVLDELGRVLSNGSRCGAREAWTQLTEVAMAMTRHAEALHRIGRRVFASTDAVFSTDPEMEANWRQFASALLAAAAGRAAGTRSRAFVARTLMLSPLVNESFANEWDEVLPGLSQVLRDDTDEPLNAAVADVLDEIGTVLNRCSTIASSEEPHGFDIYCVVHSELAAAHWLWRADRWVQAEDDGLTTPMPGDIPVARATGWQCPDMLSLRQTQARFADALMLRQEHILPPRGAGYASPMRNAQFVLALQTLALETAPLREGAPFASARAWLWRTQHGIWQGYPAEHIGIALQLSIEYLDRLGSPAQGLLDRLREINALLPEMQAASTLAIALAQVIDVPHDLLDRARQSSRAMRMGVSINTETLIATDPSSAMTWLRELVSAVPGRHRPALLPILDLIERESYAPEVAAQ